MNLLSPQTSSHLPNGTGPKRQYGPTHLFAPKSYSELSILSWLTKSKAGWSFQSGLNRRFGSWLIDTLLVYGRYPNTTPFSKHHHTANNDFLKDRDGTSPFFTSITVTLGVFPTKYHRLF